MPDRATTKLARPRELTKGARKLAPAKMRCEMSQAVRREGLRSLTYLRAVMRKDGMGDFLEERSSGFELESGERIKGGRMTEATNEIMEKMTREREPMRPMAPSRSSVSWRSSGRV